MELLCGLVFVFLYGIGAVIAFLVLSFTLRGKEFSNGYTHGMHYTNREAAEEAAMYAMMWPAYIFMKIADAILNGIAKV